MIMENTEQSKLSSLTDAINKEIPCFAPEFMEMSGIEMYPVAFQFVSVVYWKDKSVIISGLLSIAGRDYKTGYIEYDGTTDKFYRVSLTKNGRISRISEIAIDTVDNDNVESIRRFIGKMNDVDASR